MRVKEHGTSPFRYWIIEDPIDPDYAYQIYQELLKIGKDDDLLLQFYNYDNYFEKKLAMDRWQMFPKFIKKWLQWSLTSEFVDNMEKISGIEGLCVDPWLLGGGIHLHKSGGLLRVHKDFTRHRKNGLIRRLNFIVYFNRNYEKSWGGQLELWDKNMQKCEVKIDPAFNVGVLFETPSAPHGFNVPWAAPDGIQRKSLAIYLYTAPTQRDFETEHLSTQFLRAPDEETTPEIEEMRAKRNHGRLTTNIR